MTRDELVRLDQGELTGVDGTYFIPYSTLVRLSPYSADRLEEAFLDWFFKENPNHEVSVEHDLAGYGIKIRVRKLP